MNTARAAFEAHMKEIGCNDNYMSRFEGGEYIYAQGAWLSFLAGYRAGVEAAAEECQNAKTYNDFDPSGWFAKQIRKLIE